MQRYKCTLLTILLVSLASKCYTWMNCTEKDASLISNRFRKSGKGDDNSRCPTETWLEAMVAADETRHKLFVNIGFNKGYNFAIWANLFAPFSGITPMKWFQAIDDTNVFRDWKVACGQCHDCYMAFNASKWNYAAEDTFVSMIGVDLNKANVELVNNVTEILKKEKYGAKFDRISLSILFAAGSDREGNITIPACNSGDEQCKINSSDGNPDGNSTTVIVPVITVDKLVEQADASLGLFGGGQIVDMLLIDAEGHDPLVLKGAEQLFSQRRVRCIIFEYHGVGPWLQTKLEFVVRDLDERHFDCYFQGQGQLWPITGCWHANYEFHWWSNVMCVQRGDIWHTVLQDFIVDVSPILEHDRYESGRVNATNRRVEKVRLRLVELGFSSSDIESAKKHHKMHDVKSAVHWLRFSRNEEKKLPKNNVQFKAGEFPSGVTGPSEKKDTNFLDE